MRKIMLLVVAAVPAVGVFPIAAAGFDSSCNELACVSAAEDGYLVVVDGAAANPDPADGYVLVEDDGTICTGSKDGPYTDTSPGDGTSRDPNEKCGAAIAGFDSSCNELACVSAAEDGYLVVVDGAAANPDPADGYVLVEDDGTICTGSKDGPYTDTSPGDGTSRDPNERCAG